MANETHIIPYDGASIDEAIAWAVRHKGLDLSLLKPIQGFLSVESAEELPATPTAAQMVTGYLIDGELWLWDIQQGTWKDCGTIQGPQGPQGPKGDKGDNGVSIGDNYTLFSSVDSLAGLATGTKEEMIPDGNAIEEGLRSIKTNLYPFASGTTAAEIGQAAVVTSSASVDGEGNVVSGSSANYRVVYLTEPFSKGDILYREMSYSSNISLKSGWTNYDPSELDTIIGNVQLSQLHFLSNAQLHKDYQECPFEQGWYFYYYNAAGSNHATTINITWYKNTNISVVENRLTENINTIETKVFKNDLLENFISKYTTYSKKVIKADTGANISGRYGVTGAYYTTGYIPVDTIDAIKYLLPFPGNPADSNIGGSVALLAAYDSNHTFLSGNSIIITQKGTYSGTWEKGDDTAYIRFTVAAQKKYYATIPGSLEERVDSLENATTEKSIIEYNEDREGILQQTTWFHSSYPRYYLRLIHFSDLHGDTTRLKRLLEWYDEHDDVIHDIVNTGDTVANRFSNANPYASVPGSEKILTAIGNHDLAYPVTIDGTSKAEWFYHQGKDAYDKFIKPYIKTTYIDEDTQEEVTEDNWGVTQPEGAETNGYCYYYKDYDSGFRLIVLDAMSYASNGPQRTWFQGVLADARTQGLHVLCAFHFAFVECNAIKTNFARWTQLPRYGYTISNSPYLHYDNHAELIFADVQAFIDAGGTFVCHLVGHTHRDMIFTGTDYPKQIGIMVDAACCTSSASHLSNVRVPGTRSQDSFNAICAEKTNTRLYIIKIGCDSNESGQHVDWTCLDYAHIDDNREPLYTVGNASYVLENLPVDEEYEEGDTDDE